MSGTAAQLKLLPCSKWKWLSDCNRQSSFTRRLTALGRKQKSSRYPKRLVTLCCRGSSRQRFRSYRSSDCLPGTSHTKASDQSPIAVVFQLVKFFTEITLTLWLSQTCFTQLSSLARSRNAFVMTLTDDKAMAAAATAGDSSMPVKVLGPVGYR